MTITLYDDQLDLVTRVRKATARHRAVLMQSATGSGKTRMALDMIAGAHAKGSSCIFAVPRKELLAQTVQTIEEYGIPFGVISPDHAPNPFAKIQIAMTPTLARRLDRVTAPRLLFIDECHYGGAELDRVIDWSRASGGWRIGLSATPYKTNGRGMGDWYDHMEDGLPVAELMARGRLSKYRYFAPSAPDLSGIKARDGEYVQSQLQGFMEEQTAIIGDAVKTYRETALGKLCVVFSTSRKHAEIIRLAYVAAGIAAQVIDGTMNKDQRKAVIQGFARRQFTVLINVQLLTFGFDLAAAAEMDVTIEAMSDLCPRKSMPMQLQVWGRVLRMKREPAVIMDHSNNWRENGFPDDAREWRLDGTAKRAASAEKTVPAKQCPIGDGGCGFVHRPGPPCCPSCGFRYPVMSRMVDEVDGHLIEVSPEQLRLAAKQERQVQGRSETLADLIELAKRTGKNPRWAHHVWQARQRKAGAA